MQIENMEGARETFLDLLQFLADYERAGNDISNVNWEEVEKLADLLLSN